MKKQILDLGKALNRTDQKGIFGGVDFAHEGDGLQCHCNGTTYPVSDCKWCGWQCGAGTIESCS
ncbi:hypothetical protein ABHQ57_04110 [Tenacibaculum sp. ZH5_bin.1]|nr:hypothetical protein [Tenacibaculum mesophilum]KAF9659631.1 hypothetical protein HBA12_05150 [Tenacibaculum mesophilum]